MRNGWLVLGIAVALAAACGGPPGSTDATGTPTDTPPPSGTGTGTGTATPTPTGSGSGTPTPIPTITNVPSFATWQSNIKPLLSSCGAASCHGGQVLQYGNQTDTTSLHAYWFSSLCNFGAGMSGVQTYNPPVGKDVTTFCGMDAAHPVSVPSGDCNIYKAYLMHGSVAPPDCNGNYDYVNSN